MEKFKQQSPITRAQIQADHQSLREDLEAMNRQLKSMMTAPRKDLASEVEDEKSERLPENNPDSCDEKALCEFRSSRE